MRLGGREFERVDQCEKLTQMRVSVFEDYENPTGKRHREGVTSFVFQANNVTGCIALY